MANYEGIDGEEFQSKEEYVQYLSDNYSEVLRERFALAQKEEKLIECMMNLTSDTEDKIELHGKTDKIVIKPRTNVSYEDIEKIKTPAYIDSTYPSIGAQLFRIEYKERGAAVEKFLEAEPETKIEKEIHDLLKQKRLTRPGKPEIKVRSIESDVEE